MLFKSHSEKSGSTENAISENRFNVGAKSYLSKRHIPVVSKDARINPKTPSRTIAGKRMCWPENDKCRCDMVLLEWRRENMWY